MTYRLYVQPLTEKTKLESKDSELLVNTRTGHLIVNDQSATKDIEGELFSQKYLVSTLKSIITLLETEISNLEALYQTKLSETNDLYNRMNGLKELLAQIIAILNTLENQIRQNTVDIWSFVDIIATIIPKVVEKLPGIFSIQRRLSELTYLYNFIKGYKTKTGTDLTNMRSRYTTVEKNVDSSAFQSTYDSWVTSLVNKTKGKISNKKVKSITFKHII
ncbi:hypothetical protein FPHOBKDP_00211 [Listeria phage LPJP1]|nr:hypothetical protein FPHOBKDP_00211 [Listeria phage LPJP1]